MQRQFVSLMSGGYAGMFGAILLATVPLGVVAKADEADAFRRTVAPILERRCLSCHNDIDRKGGLSLTSREQLEKGGESGPVVVAKKPDESPLWEQVRGEKPEMPKSGAPLTAAEAEAIRSWIAAGASWPAGLVLEERPAADRDWWSLKSLQRPEPPAIAKEDTSFARNPIDAFVLSKLREQKLRPSPQADRRTLIRRLYFDLLGLPPSPEAIERFVSDRDPEAYSRLVDALLEQPQYGERWARHWLDVVHYGDTHGYDKDKLRPNAWPYRDY
ncbi:MAG: hypothetical protein RIS70_4451, partial [Planctomycetota bacterium]